MALLRSFATVGGYTGISRILGFVRDILFAAILGHERLADVFFVAFRLPNLFRRLFAEGAFNAAFVPMFSGCLEDSRQEAVSFAEQALAALVFVLLVLTVAAMAAMPWFMYALAPGFAGDPEKFDLTVHLSRVTFPYLLFLSLAALLGGILNSLYKFAAAAAAPILLNVFFIAAVVLIVPITGAPEEVLAWTVTAAGLGQFLFVVLACRRAGISLRMRRPRLTPSVRRLIRLMGPGLFSAGAMQINIMVGTIIASFQAGAVSYLYYADRVYQLPLGLIGIGLGVVLLPHLTRSLRGGAEAEAMDTLNRGLELSMLLTLPAAVALMVIPWPIVVVLFERGAFDRSGSEATALALMAFAGGLPAYVLVKVLQPAFFAREDTMTPFRMAVATVAANIVLSLALFWPLGHVGIALATALSAWLNVVLLGGALFRRGFLTLDVRLKARLPRVALAGLVMGAGLWVLLQWLLPWFDGSQGWRIAGLVLLVGGGLGLYAVLALTLGALRMDELKALRRPPAAPPS